MMGKLKFSATLLALACGLGTPTAGFAQEQSIEQRLPAAPLPWFQQADKKIRYESYTGWIVAFDTAVRIANVSMCGQGRDNSNLSLLAGVDGATIAWRSDNERSYYLNSKTPYLVGDVVWADSKNNAGLTTGDVLIHYTGKLYNAKKPKFGEPFRVIPTGDAALDAIVAKHDPKNVLYLHFQGDEFKPVEGVRNLSTRLKTCGGAATVSFGGMAISLSSMVKGATGIGKELIDNDPNRYYRGSHLPVFRRFTADQFTPDQAKWMVADQFSADLSEFVFFEKTNKEQFDAAEKKLETATAQRLGLPTTTDAFGLNWRARAAFIAVYAGARMGLKEADYVAFLNERDRVLHGSTNPDKAKLRAEILRGWFAAMANNPKKDGMTAEDLVLAAKAL
jgi:hypothetical protein